MTDLPAKNLSTEHQPKGAALNQSATLDRDVGDARERTQGVEQQPVPEDETIGIAPPTVTEVEGDTLENASTKAAAKRADNLEVDRDLADRGAPPSTAGGATG